MSPCLEHFLYNMPSPSHAQKYFHLLQQVRGGCAVGVTYLTLPIGLKHCLVIAYHSNKRAVRCSHCHMCQSFNASLSFTHTHTHTLWIWRSGRWGTREKRIEEGIGSSTPLLTCFAYSGCWIFMVSMSLKSILCSSLSHCPVTSRGHCLQLSGHLRRSELRQKIESEARRVLSIILGTIFFLFLTPKHMAFVLGETRHLERMILIWGFGSIQNQFQSFPNFLFIQRQIFF